MSSHSTGRFEKSLGTPARIAVGNSRRPSPFIINDHRLRVVLEGVTPATVELRAGAYEIEVYSEDMTQSSVLQAGPGSCLDASDLGVPVDTDIPVSCAEDRDQFVAEAVSRASGALRDTRCGSGLVIIVLDKTAGDESSAAEQDIRFTLLDATYKKLHHQVGELEGGVLCWHSTLEQGGYVVRLDAPGAPDLVATSSDEQLDFPPMLASGIPATLGQTGGAPNRIIEGSLLEASYERLARLGPLLTWKADRGGIPKGKRFAARAKAVPTFPIALTIDWSSIIEIVRRLWILFVGALAGYRLFHRPPEKVVGVLQRLGKASSVRRVALYLADLALVGQSRRVRMTLAGLNLRDLSEATSLPRSIVESALSEIRGGLTRTAIRGELMHTDEEPWDL